MNCPFYVRLNMFFSVIGNICIAYVASSEIRKYYHSEDVAAFVGWSILILLCYLSYKTDEYFNKIMG